MPENGIGDTVVVGVDGSDASIDALRYGGWMAGVLGATLTAVTSWRYPPAYDTYVPLQWSPEHDAGQILDDAINTAFGAEPPAGLRRVVRKGQPAQVLMDESSGARMLILGSRGLGGFTGMLLGSVSAACAAHADCPVLVLRGKRPVER